MSTVASCTPGMVCWCPLCVGSRFLLNLVVARCLSCATPLPINSAKGCGVCGGAGCASRGNGGHECCMGRIYEAGEEESATLVAVISCPLKLCVLFYTRTRSNPGHKQEYATAWWHLALFLSPVVALQQIAVNERERSPAKSSQNRKCLNREALLPGKTYVSIAITARAFVLSRF